MGKFDPGIIGHVFWVILQIRPFSGSWPDRLISR